MLFIATMCVVLTAVPAVWFIWAFASTFFDSDDPQDFLLSGAFLLTGAMLTGLAVELSLWFSRLLIVRLHTI